jgi:hypothetical protein
MQFATKLRNAPQYGVMASSGRRIAEERTVDKFADAVVMTYQETLM